MTTALYSADFDPLHMAAGEGRYVTKRTKARERVLQNNTHGPYEAGKSSHIQGGSSYWNAGYHLNIRLYERLLSGVFDILDKGQLIKEHADYLKLVKLMWGTLGITQKMHDALYGWVLFQQFVETKEMPLLDQANLQVQKVLSTNYEEGNEEQFTYTIMYTDDDDGTEIRLSLVQAIFRSINLWCDARLQDYHLHFNEKPDFLRRLVSMGLVVGRHNTATVNEVKVKSSDASGDAAAVRVRFYVKRSLEAALQRVEDTINLISKMEGKHPLALLARELRLIAERELSVFSPVLCQWCPDARIFASVHLHQYYGERLKPFLDDITFSEDATSVLSEAHRLEHYLIRASNLINEENGVGSLSIQEFESYLLPSLSLRRKQVTEPQPPKKARGRPRKIKPEVEVEAEKVSADSGVLELLMTEGENLPDKELEDTESSKAEQREDEHAQVTEPQPPKKARGRPRKAKPEVEVEGKKDGKKRGRPKKDPDGSPPPKRPRGRPVKQVKQVEQDPIASNPLVEEEQDPVADEGDTSLSLVFERLCIDISTLSDDPLPDIVQDDMLDESEIIKMEEAHEVYKAAIDNLEEHENEEALTAAADARLLLQSILLRS